MDKIDIEADLQAAAYEVIAPLRQGRGLDVHAAERLKKALRAAAAAWQDADAVTKSAASLFVDLASGIDACSDAYSGNEASTVRIFADEVADLVRRCVEVPYRAAADARIP